MINLAVANASQALEYVNQLRNNGLVADRDFRWKYVPSQYDGWDDTTHTQPCVELWFFNESLESFYKLKWA